MSVLLRPLATAFRYGVALRAASYHRGWLKTRRLSRPVVSVGNLTVGGSGKTPLVAYIAEALLKHGQRPGILTRGYGRRGHADLVTVEPGDGCRNPDPREIGDEPALLAQRLPSVPMVVCADRYRGGCVLEQRFGVDVHLLDDGFQHWALARDVDIIALDSTQALSDRALLPAGQQREPCSALARAHLVVLTRTELGEQPTIEALERKVRQINPQAEIFRSTTKFQGLRDVRGATGLADTFAARDGKPVFAFCGIGNPQSFFANLQQWGFQVAGEKSYRDHHVYTPADLDTLRSLARRCGASALLTTEKDALNLPPTAEGLPIFACVIQAELSEAEEFEERLLARICRVPAQGLQKF